uniref:Uncharacterized protein n=1 Tax=viral metagenome TaxID=1070528 RepID=A0A6H1ZWR1_9ZZZZ
MRYRIYFKHEDVPEKDWQVREIEADGVAYRICDDHGHVVFGEPWSKKPIVFNTLGGREPGCYC